MTEDRRKLLRRVAMMLAWISALYGTILVLDGYEANNTAGWFFFLTPIVLVVGERITRGDPEEEDEADETRNDTAGDDPSSPPPSSPS
jgi:hypothetical protein